MTEPAQVEAWKNRQPTAERPSIRVMMVDDQMLLRESVEALIRMETDLEFAGSFGSVHGLLEAIGERQPDVVLLDIRLGTASGLDLIPRVRQAAANSRTIMLTAHAEAEYVAAALEAGAAGYVHKTANSRVLMQAIRAVSSGSEYLCIGADSAYRSASRTMSRSGTAQKQSSLTKRELEVLNCVVGGNSNKLTARRLGMSPKTVAKHRANLMRKLNLHNISGLTKFAYHHGMLGETAADLPLPAPAIVASPSGNLGQCAAARLA